MLPHNLSANQKQHKEEEGDYFMPSPQDDITLGEGKRLGSEVFTFQSPSLFTGLALS